MELTRTIREKHQTKREEEIAKQAEKDIRIADFDNSLFIAYGGTPFVPIDAEWTTKEIVEQLAILRSNYVRAKMAEEDTSLVGLFL